MDNEGITTVIVTPDYQGKSLQKNAEGAFTDTFTQQMVEDTGAEHRVWMVGINGLPTTEMVKIADGVRGRVIRLQIDPVVCEEGGQIPTIDQCYQRAVQKYASAALLIKKDGREHPQSAVPLLEAKVPGEYDHVGIGLTYEEGMLGPNDRQGDTDLRVMVKQELGFELSHAHGMQGIAMRHMPETHRVMLRIKQMMRERYSIELAWGYDLLFRLVSVMSGRKFLEIDVPAVVAREDRPAEKIRTQIDNWGKVIRHGKALFPEARAVKPEM